MNLVGTNKNILPVAALSMSFLSGDVNNFVIGGEDGAVSSACRHGRCVVCDMSKHTLVSVC